jgi:hypothetical protein
MKKTSETKNLAYVPIYNPVSFRRHILLSSIDIINILEKYETLKQIRNEKKALILNLKERMIDLNNDVIFLKEFFPEVSKHELKKETREVEEKIDTVKYPKKSEGYRNLQRELQEIQDKLNSLNI